MKQTASRCQPQAGVARATGQWKQVQMHGHCLRPGRVFIALCSGSVANWLNSRSGPLSEQLSGAETFQWQILSQWHLESAVVAKLTPWARKVLPRNQWSLPASSLPSLSGRRGIRPSMCKNGHSHKGANRCCPQCCIHACCFRIASVTQTAETWIGWQGAELKRDNRMSGALKRAFGISIFPCLR